MAKTAEVTALTLTVDPRVRMKEIRAMVSNHLKGKAVSDDIGHLKHLGELPDNMEDARRVIVATQDEAEDARERHRKATTHVAELVHFTEFLMNSQNELLEQLFEAGRRITELTQLLNLAENRAHEITMQSFKANGERDAVLTTMRLLNQNLSDSRAIGINQASDAYAAVNTKSPY